jgi:hypothetical protein
MHLIKRAGGNDERLKHIWPYLMACTLVVIGPPLQGLAQQNSGVSKTSVQYAPAERDGQHDFDFEIGIHGLRIQVQSGAWLGMA